MSKLDILALIEETLVGLDSRDGSDPITDEDLNNWVDETVKTNA